MNALTQFPRAERLSLPIGRAKDSYEIVVIGSGYGAGVAASRLARAGREVCMLERGREIRPGEYPEKLAQAQDAMQANTARGRLGDPHAMFEMHVNEDMWALVGCGLGGTSLINANVSLEIEPRLFEAEHWPQVFRDKPLLLAPFYDRARDMLGVNPYPDERPEPNKLAALREAAEKLQQTQYRTPINVNFEDKTNRFGVPQPACNDCGNCVSGCNVGAKNTVLMNYLPDAANHGAQIFTEARVEWIERVDNAGSEGWKVHLEGGRSISAQHVVLGAGTLGSTEILLRSKAKGLSLSDHLGRGFSGNGDVLGYSYDSYWKPSKDDDGNVTSEPLNAIGRPSDQVPEEGAPGPCITGIIDMRNSADVGRGLVVEEGVVPSIIAPLLGPAFFFCEANGGNFARFGMDEIKPRLMDAKDMGLSFQSDPGAIGEWAYKGPVSRLQTFLVMSVEDSRGTLAIENDRLAIDWPRIGVDPAIVQDNSVLEQVAGAMSGQFFPNPLWTDAIGKKLVTVHPVGGCGMGDDASHGVIDHACRVFSGEGEAVHRGLYVCDGAAMSGPVGVNPLLTISAVAERAVELMAAREGWEIDWSLDEEGPLPAIEAEAPTPETEKPQPQHFELVKQRIEHMVDASVLAQIAHAVAGIEHAASQGALDEAKRAVKKLVIQHPELMSPQFGFTERMSGFVSAEGLGNPCAPHERISDDFAAARAWGASEGTACAFELTVHTDDLNALVSRPEHQGVLTGEVTCDLVSPHPMTVREGRFNLLTIDPDHPERWLMSYVMVLDRAGAGPVHFHGFKTLQQRKGSNPWTDLTTLFVTITDGADGNGPVLAKGMLDLNLTDLMWQAKSFDLPCRDNLVGHLIERVPAAKTAIAEYFLAKFAALFGLSSFQAYGGMLATLNDFPGKQAESLPHRPLDAPEPERHVTRTGDGWNVGLTRYRGGVKGPVILAPGFSVKASSFATDTVPRNLVEELCAANYDVWLFDYRASADSGNPVDPPQAFTIDDIARHDWPAAVDFVRRKTGAHDVQAMAHCVGSMSLLMALAGGYVSNIRSVVSSQLTLHPVTDWMNYLKADIGTASLMGQVAQLGGHIGFAPKGTDLDYEIDAVAYNLPVPEGQECKNPACRRVFGIFGPSYDHAQLGHDTHVAIADMFSDISLKPFDQLSAIMHEGRAVDAEGHEAYLGEENALRLALPITFLSGANNQIFYPESAQRTRAWLASHNDPSLYDQIVIPGYAHMDLFIGRHAARDVAPTIVEQLDRFN
ncbi:alpha/beta fold hydrolase [Pseudoblastomonas halimionae]|uniref:Cholesterol oxidase n=1 Tax=Alteriqipengyuania halimionae TaxID=1926630 RepID=A0A6I4U4P5_9SPHN|nr:alpha/beta fold hydrolase [Alteriqipengyuania halimionae]MXP09883.1 alpha/beta fold hydrolase [Alteriqipengyuania halimionae]